MSVICTTVLYVKMLLNVCTELHTSWILSWEYFVLFSLTAVDNRITALGVLVYSVEVAYDSFTVKYIIPFCENTQNNIWLCPLGLQNCVHLLSCNSYYVTQKTEISLLVNFLDITRSTRKKTKRLSHKTQETMHSI